MISDPFFLTFLAATALLVVFAFFIVYFAIRHRNNLINHDKEKKGLLLEVQNAKIEEAERVMEQMSKYVHDNIGQIAHILKMNIHTIETFQLKDDEFLIVDNAVTLAGRIVTASRSISHSLSSEIIKKQGLETTIRNELRFIETAQNMSFSLKVNGYSGFLNADKELLVFRILQEVIHNALKHAEATVISIWLIYHEDAFQLSIKDNGQGFDTKSLKNSSGLGYINMQQRANNLNGYLDIVSAPGEGCIVTLSINCPLKCN